MNKEIYLEEIEFKSISLHRVGNKAQDEGYITSSKPLELDEETKEVLLGYLMNSFKEDKLYQFNHQHDLSMNETYVTVGNMFEGDYWAHAGSIELLKNLYNTSTHVKVKGGEFYVALIEGCIYNDELVQAVGIFKAEDKETFLKLKLDDSEEYTIDFQEGNSASKIDKGCIVFNVECQDGYRILNVDLKSADAKFWQDDFLGITEVKDEHYHTKMYMKLCNSFATAFFSNKSKLDKVHFVACCKDYFENFNHFNLQEFKDIIIKECNDPEAIETFEAALEIYKSDELIEEEFDEEFLICKDAFKSKKKNFKTKIKLDTQVEVSVTSSECKDNGFIEEGFDEDKEMKYYKVYFVSEKA